VRGLRILLLGPPRLELDGQPLTRLIAPKHLALVFYLAVRGAPVSREPLATLLWGDLAEAAARANLRVALSRLRRWLPGFLDIDAQQVGFERGAPLSLDLAELALAQDPACPHDDRMAAARAWRGPLLDGFSLGGCDEFERWVAQTRQRAQREAVALRRDLARHACGLGQTSEAIEHLRALLEIDDADETAHMALMDLLASLGQRTAAIAQYEACRAALAERLGARPSAACYGRYVRIHADAPLAPDLAPPPAEVLQPGSAIRPGEMLPCVGRTGELALLSQRLADPGCRWLTVVGPGGVGKTRLAQVAAAQLALRFRHGLMWLDCRECGGAWHDAQGLTRHVLERIRGDCHAAGALLLVLDNLETVPFARELAQALHTSAAGVSVLATSRRRMGGSREWLLELPGLSLTRGPGEPASASEAAQMLGHAACRLDPRFDVDAHREDLEHLCRLVGGLPLALVLAAGSLQRIGLQGVIQRLQAGQLPADLDAGDEHRHRSLGVVLDESWAMLGASTRAAAQRLAWLPGRFDVQLASAIGAPPDEVESLRAQSWLACDEQGLLVLHPLQQDYLRRAEPHALTRPQVIQALADHQVSRLPVLAPFGDWPADGPAPAAISMQPAFGQAELQAVLDHLAASQAEDRLARWLDSVIALLSAGGRGPEAAKLLGRAAALDRLPAWRTGGWMLRQGEMLNALGDGDGARRLFEQALYRLGLNPLSPHDEAAGQGLPRSVACVARLRPWPPDPVHRRAFTRLLLRCLMFLAQQHTFAPQTLAAARTQALTSVLTLRTGSKSERLAARIGNAYGAALFGFPRIASAASHGLQHRPRIRGDPLLEAFSEHTLCALRLALGHWEALLPRIEACVQVFVRHGDYRHEMESHSLAGKLLLYQGQLCAAQARFALCHERGMQLPAGAYRSFGPFGLAEVGLSLGTVSHTELERLADLGSHWITQMENMDNAYSLRRLGLLVRLAWLAGDARRARETVMAGVAAAARFERCGFWAHEGYAGIGEGLLALRRHELAAGGSLPPLDRAWASYAQALEGHVRRFPPASAMRHRLLGQALLERGHAARAREHLQQAIRSAESRGMHVELARCCDVMAPLQSAADWHDRARKVWAEVRRS